MLKATLATGAAMLISNRIGFSQDSKPEAASEGKRVVVIGAGFSGLASAYELMSAGYDVTVIEARARVERARAHLRRSRHRQDVEGGGELIGSNHPTWVAYAEQFGLEFLDVSESEDEAPIVLNGKRLSAEEVREALGGHGRRRSRR